MGVIRVVILCTKGEISEQRRKGNGYEKVKLAKLKGKKIFFSLLSGLVVCSSSYGHPHIMT